MKSNLTGRMGRWSALHPWRAIGIWLAFVVAAVAVGGAVGAVKLTDADQGTKDSGRAEAAISANFDRHAEEAVLVHSDRLTAADAEFQRTVQDTVDNLKATGFAINLRAPIGDSHLNQISADGHSALIQFEVPGPTDAAPEKAQALLDASARTDAAHPDVDVEEAGDATLMNALNETLGKDLKHAEQLSLPITLFVLLLTFGALVAALVPLALAITAILAATGLLALTSHVSGIDGSANSVMLLIGLAVGVDYSLFYVKREREERAKGSPKDAALAAAAATSGRSVLISGITVLVAMAAMFLTGFKLFYGMGEATMLVVLTAMLGSLTVLPAILSLLGDRIEKGRLPFIGRFRRPEGQSRVWSYVVDRALRRPALATVVSVATLLGLATPLLSLHTSQPGITDVPRDLAVVQTYDRIQAAFPGGGAPATVVVTAPDVTTRAVQDGIAAMRDAALATGQMNEPISVTVSDNHRAALVQVPLAGNGEDAASAQALATLRGEVIPSTIDKVAGVDANVTGLTAGTEDFNMLMGERMPIVVGFVLLLAFVLLTASFRSVVVAAKAIVLNVLSVAAAYGILVAVFQWGWGESLLSFHSTGSITSWIPLFLFVILFGLSMDYHVFILSRIRERFDAGDSTARAVAHGIKSTAGVVTAAAAVMVMVFLTFATLSQVTMKQMGVGLAVAVLLDATLVRGVLLPAAMKLLGDWNWYLPRWLSWLPDISHGAESPTVEPSAAPDTEQRLEPAF
jgi:putative drug exporter of the RND superfamily